MRRFEHQVAVVTGGATPVGLAVALRLGAEGARVVLVDDHKDEAERAADLLDAKGIEGRLIVGHCGNPEVAKWAIATAKMVWGRLDVIVHAPRTHIPAGLIADSSAAGMDRGYYTTLRGLMLLCNEAAPLMKQRDYGRIVTVTTRAGQDGEAGNGAAAAIEASVVATVKSVARSLADTGIRANCVVVGREGGEETRSEKREAQDEKREENDRTGVGVRPTADEVAAMVAWLASPECSFTTGAVYNLSSGSTY